MRENRKYQLFLSVLILLFLSVCQTVNSESHQRLRAYRPYYSSVFQQNAQVDEVINHHGSRLRREELHAEPEESILPSDYDPYVPPYRRDEDDREFTETFIVSEMADDIMQVNASILVFNVRDINEVSEDYNVEVNLRLYWLDERLAHDKLTKEKLNIPDGYDYAVLNPKLIEKLWTPDIYIEHVKNTSQPALISKPSSLRIYPDGGVRYSARITIKMSCQMDFTYYPADTQVCTISLRSFTFKNDKMQLSWHDPPKIVEEFKSHSFDIRVAEAAQREVANPFSKRGRKFWRLDFDIRLKRQLSFHLWQTFFPSMVFVVTSWTSFWVPPEIVSARTTVCMSALLTQTMMFSSVRQNTPNESYAKALDVWMLVCMFFGFLTLLEYTLILKLNSLKVKKKEDKEEEEDDYGEIFHWFNWKNLNFNILKRKEEDEGPSSISPVSYLSWQYVDGKEFVPYQIKRPKLRQKSGNVTPTSGTNSFAFSIGSPSQSIHQRSVSPPPSQNSPQPPGKLEKKQEEDGLTKFKLFTIRMDRVSRFAFPAAFLLFNLIYWPTLLIKSNYYSY